MSDIPIISSEFSCSEKSKPKLKQEPLDVAEMMSVDNEALSGKALDFQYSVQPKQELVDVKLEDPLYLVGEIIELPDNENNSNICMEENSNRNNNNNKDYFCPKCNTNFPVKNHDLHEDYINIINQVTEQNPYVCKECKTVFSKFQNALQHLLLHDQGKNIFNCYYCDYNSKTLSDLKCHMETVHSELKKPSKVYSCCECSFKTNYYLNLRKHVNSQHSSLYYKCNQCDGYWPDKDHTLHEKMMHINKQQISEKNPFVCKYCKLEFIETNKIYEHIKLHGNIGFYCTGCAFNSDTLPDLERHKQTEHSDQLRQLNGNNQEDEAVSKTLCLKCDLYWPDRNHEVHEKILKIIERGISEENPYTCYGCKEEIRDAKKLYYHVTLHCKGIRCDECSFRTDYDYRLKRHKRNVHPKPHEIQYHCNLCDYKAVQLKNYIRHQDMHKSESEKVYHNCDECNFRTTHFEYIAKHKRRVHPNDKNATVHTCKICGYSSREQGYLKKHMVIHRTDEVHCCEFCTFETRTRVYLERHKMKIHLQPKKNTQTYVCEECARVFKFKPSLHRHLFNVHGKGSELKKYICHTCNYESVNRHSFIGHVQRHVKNRNKMYCANCEYKTFNKTNLVQHMVSHADSSKLKMHKCTICSFTTKRAHTLRHHIKTH